MSEKREQYRIEDVTPAEEPEEVLDLLRASRDRALPFAETGQHMSTVRYIPGSYCGDCAWWKQQHDSYGLSELGAVFPGRCEKADMDRQNTHKSLAMASDYDEYGAELWTAPDFGCVQFGMKSALHGD